MNREEQLRYELRYLFQVRDEVFWTHETNEYQYEQLREAFIKKWAKNDLEGPESTISEKT